MASLPVAITSYQLPILYMPHARQEPPAAPVHMRVPGVAVRVPVPSVRGMGVRARRVRGGVPEGEQRSHHTGLLYFPNAGTGSAAGG